MTLLQGAGHGLQTHQQTCLHLDCSLLPYLQDLLVLLCVCMLHLLRRGDVVLEVSASVLPCLKALKEELGDLFQVRSRPQSHEDHVQTNLAGVLVRDDIVVGAVGSSARRQSLRSHGVCWMDVSN